MALATNKTAAAQTPYWIIVLRTLSPAAPVAFLICSSILLNPASPASPNVFNAGAYFCRISAKNFLKFTSCPKKVRLPVLLTIVSRRLGNTLVTSANSFLPIPKEEAIVSPVLAKPKRAGVTPINVPLRVSSNSLFCNNPLVPPSSGIALNTLFVAASPDREVTKPPTELCKAFIPIGV